MPTPSRCPRCGAALPVVANLPGCPNCGAALPAPEPAGAWWQPAPASAPPPPAAPAPTGNADAWWLSAPAPAPPPPAVMPAPLPHPPAPISVAPAEPPPAPIPVRIRSRPPAQAVEPAPPPPPNPPSFLPLFVLAGVVGAMLLVMASLALVALLHSTEEPPGPGGPPPPPPKTKGPPPSPPAPPPRPPKGKGPAPGAPGEGTPVPPKPKKVTPLPPPRPREWVLLRDLEARLRHSGFKAARGLTADERGTVYVSDAGLLYKVQGDRRPAVFLKDGEGCNGLAIGARGNLLACLGRTGRVVGIDVASREAREVAGGLGGKRFNNPRHLAVRRGGGLYLTDGPAPDVPDDKGAVCHVAPGGAVTRLPLSLARPRGVALSPDGRTLYVVGVGSSDVMAYPLEAPASPGAGRALCQLEGGGVAVAVDARGHLFVMSPALPGVQVISPGGERLASLKLPDAPVSCALGGEGQRTLFVLTRHDLYTVAVAVPR